MPAGRPRKPLVMKLSQGTFQKCRNPISEPEPHNESIARKAPDYLNKHAKKHWNDLAQECVDMGTLTSADWTLFTALCESWGEYREGYDAVYTYQDEKGKPHKRTLGQYMKGKSAQTVQEYAAMRKALADYRTLAALFGLGAANRNKIDLKQKKQDETTEIEKQWKEMNG